MAIAIQTIRGVRSSGLRAILITAIAIGGGCQSAGRRTEFQSKPDVAVSSDQLRLRMRSMVAPLCGEIEASADEIIAGTPDKSIQLAALEWKIDAVPTLREALFQPDPFVAAFDTLVLCYQMQEYFRSGAGAQSLGPAAGQALETCERLEQDVLGVFEAATHSGDSTKSRVFASEWAAAHPIRRSIADRESLLARSLEAQFAEQISASEAIAEATTTMDDLSRKLEVYSHQLVRQARWEAERFRRESIAELNADRAIPLAERAVQSAELAVASSEQAVKTIERLAPIVERSLGVAADTPGIIASEREALVAAIREELRFSVQSVREERIAALEELTKERIIALAELEKMIDEQRTRLESEARHITINGIDHGMQSLTRLLILAGIAAFLAVVVSLLLAKMLFPGRDRRAVRIAPAPLAPVRA